MIRLGKSVRYIWVKATGLPTSETELSARIVVVRLFLISVDSHLGLEEVLLVPIIPVPGHCESPTSVSNFKITSCILQCRFKPMPQTIFQYGNSWVI